MDVDELTKAKAEPAPTLRIAESEPVISDEAFASAYGETIDRAIDIDTWHAGEDMADLYSRLDQVIGEAVQEEDATARRVRDVIFPRLAQRPGAPPGAGVYQAQMPQLERVHRGLLFNGGVEGCDGTSSPPSLDTWVKSLEFSACILGREAPINRNATRVPVGLPSREFVL